jgi:KDO2-lipid IV(A) lauroyltransferase
MATLVHPLVDKPNIPTFTATMGARLVYYLLLKPISLLPYFLLYRVSDFVALVFMTVFPYRKKVILSNLQRCFPEQSEKERKRLLRKFYRHIADIFVESFKNFSVTEAQVKKRMKAVHPEVVNDQLAKGRGVVLAGGHMNNWELYAMAAAGQFNGKSMAIYKRLSNAWFDAKMRETRGRFGLMLVPTKEATAWMKEHSSEPLVSIYGFDQSPANPKKSLWLPFFGEPTATYYGPEKHARDYGMAVVYGSIQKVKRGHYQIVYSLVAESVVDAEKGSIMAELNRRLEEDIRREPAHWLWSHKRWKHKMPEELQ